MTVEITLPVLNEEVCLKKSILKILSFFDAHHLNDWSVIIVDNGSTDETPVIAQELCGTYPETVKYLRLEERGVGTAVRYSWSQSQADIVGYMDIDLATDLKHLLDVKELFTKAEITVINGSRFLPDSVVLNRKFIRRITSFILNKMMQIMLKNKFSDAMCGFKFFKRHEALYLLNKIPLISDWFVCAELLVRSEWNRKKVYEIPVHWTDDPNSKARIIYLAKQYIGHILRLRREAHT